jgi:hypothetical protein
MRFQRPHSRAQRIGAAIAAVFGAVTLFAGGRILLGLGEAGYAVVSGVLIFNTIMGLFYLVAAILIVRSVEAGRIAAGAIAIVNLAVLTVIVVRRLSGGIVANETMIAMTLRTVVWMGIFALLSRSLRQRSPASVG